MNHAKCYKREDSLGMWQSGYNFLSCRHVSHLAYLRQIDVSVKMKFNNLPLKGFGIASATII